MKGIKNKHINHEVRDKMLKRQYILDVYGDKVRETKTKLCDNCAPPPIFEGKCKLLPVTTNGEDCPYYTAKVEE